MAALRSKRLKGQLADLHDDYILCRTRRHQFEDVPFTGRRGAKWQPSSSILILAQRCLRCTVERHEIWNVYTGEIVKVQYLYPPGYSLDREIKPINVRREYIDRRRNAKPGTFGKL